MKYPQAILLITYLVIASCNFKGRKVSLKETCFGITTEAEYDHLKLTESRKYWFELQEMIAFRHAFVLLPGTTARILKTDKKKALIEVKVEGKIIELWVDAQHLH